MRPNAPGRDAPPPHNIRWSRRRRSGSPNATREILSQLHSLAPRHIGAAQLPVMRASEGRPISAETPFRGLAEFWRGPSLIVSVVLRSRVEDGLAGSLSGPACYPHGLLASLVARASNDGLGGASAEAQRCAGASAPAKARALGSTLRADHGQWRPSGAGASNQHPIWRVSWVATDHGQLHKGVPGPSSAGLPPLRTYSTTVCDGTGRLQNAPCEAPEGSEPSLRDSVRKLLL